MSLLELQANLIDMVKGQRGPRKSDLTSTEEAFLTELESSRGLEVTRDVYRWWRRARLHTSLPLTALLIDRDPASSTLYAGYFDRCGCQTLFFGREGEQFAAYLRTLSLGRVHPYVEPLLELELALRRGRARSEEPPPAVTLSMPVDPFVLIDALLRGRSLPDPSASPPATVEIGPHLPRGWRVRPTTEPSTDEYDRSTTA